MRVLLQGLQAGNRSGTGRYTSELVRAFAGLAEGPEVVCLWPRELAAPAQGERLELVRRRSGFAYRFYHERLAVFRLAGKFKADLIHFPATVAAPSGQAPVIVTVHDLCYKTHPEWFPRTRVFYYTAFADAGIRRAARIIADSHATAADIRHFYGIPESRIDVIPLGVDACFQPADDDARKGLRERYDLPESFFLFLGTLEPRKNLPRILEAWMRAGPSVPDLVLAGRAGWKVDLERLVGGGLDARRLHCLGHVPQELLPALYSEAQAFVWPSLMEGFGLPPLEAMACGAPVITSNTSSMAEVAGNAALTVDPLNVRQLSDAMTALAEDERLRQSLREAGLDRAADFTWKRTAELTMLAYEHACRDNGRPI